MRHVQVRKGGKRFQQAGKAAACSPASSEGKAAERRSAPHRGPLTSWREQAERSELDALVGEAMSTVTTARNRPLAFTQ
jgi:hypothetical protein